MKINCGVSAVMSNLFLLVSLWLCSVIAGTTLVTYLVLNTEYGLFGIAASPIIGYVFGAIARTIYDKLEE